MFRIACARRGGRAGRRGVDSTHHGVGEALAVMAMADTLRAMDAPRGEPAASRYDELHAEAADALGFAANTLRGIRDRYRQAYIDEMARWEDARRRPRGARTSRRARDGGGRPRLDASSDGAAIGGRGGRRGPPAPRSRGPTRPNRRGALGRHEAELSRLELAIRNLETTWLFIERGDASLVDRRGAPAAPDRAPDADRRGPGGRARPARAGGPRRTGAGALERDLPGGVHRPRLRLRPATWPGPSCGSCASCCAVSWATSAASSASCGRPCWSSSAWTARSPTPCQPGRAVGPAHHDASSRHRPTASTEAAQTVVLRVVQEALQNVRKHAGATNVVVATMLDGWRMGAGGPRRRSRVRYRSGRGARPSQLRAPVHARAGRARRRTV